MKIKLDENFGTRAQHLFRSAGHDVQTVREEGLTGCTDQRLLDVCSAEKRLLVTFDLDFSNVIRFPPGKCAGIVVLRTPVNAGLPLIEQMIRQLLSALTSTAQGKRLWIIEPGRIRMHQAEEGE